MKGEGIENKAEVKNKEVWLCLVDAIRSRELRLLHLLSTTYVPPLRIYTGARPVFATPAVACIVLCYDARHLTTAEGALANRDSVLKYSGTSGRKTTRAAADHARYLSQSTRRESKHPSNSLFPLALSVLCLPPLDLEINWLYHTSLPESHPLFREALAKPDALDESDLHRWKAEPPFEEDNDASDPDSDCLPSIHPISCRCSPRPGVTALREELETLLLGWERVKALNIYHEHHDSREFAMCRHYLQWQARTIYHLYHLKFLD
ncbi:hypothetical protein DFH09DRAFT_1097328 [Mycena vulgaris]|nr:hypothetical protein DFH09DRAFT_1097328 [Mycena vulgaris]